MNLLDLPDCMLEQIFEHLTFDEISKKRLVCVEINRICQHLLNVGFNKMIKRHTFHLKKIKSQLPRRESERRNHALSKHADILTCIETRISMLSMTYTKYIDMNLCCFIPGKIIDEVLCILKLVDTTNRPLRAHEVLQELRDISSMAIDHFDEKIAPILKKSFCDLSTQKFGSNFYQIMQSPMDTVMPDFSADIFQVRAQQPDDTTIRCQDSQKNQMAIIRMERKYDSMLKKMNRIIQVQSKYMREVRNNAVQLSELKTQMLEFRRRYDDTTNVSRIGSLTTGFVDGNSSSSAVVAPSYHSAAQKSRNDIVDEEISSPSHSSSSSSSEVALIREGSPSPSSSDASSPSPPLKKNIKPRAATIILKRRIAEPGASTAAKQSRK